MAARKSCTHLTWAEAKSKAGGSSGGGGGTKKNLKNVAHSKILADKIIAKSGTPQEKTISKAKLKRAQREDEKAVAAIQAAKEERERERRSRTVKPHEQAILRMKELAKQTQTLSLKNGIDENARLWDSSCMDKMNEIKECKEMQLDEIMALEAIYAESEEFLVLDASQLEEAREFRERLFSDDGDEAALRALVTHPPIAFAVQLRIDDSSGQCSDSDLELVASILLKVEFPARYPLQSEVPRFYFQDIMITDKKAVCSPDKSLESLAFLDEAKLLEAMLKEASELLPDPCVYEVVTWLSENAFTWLEMRTHATIT